MPPRHAIGRRTAILTVASAALSHLLGAEEDRQPAPRFTAKTLDGEKLSNESLKGKVVLVQFWATWCQYCRRDQPSVDSIVGDFADKGLVVLAVNVGEPKRKVKEYLAGAFSRILLIGSSALILASIRSPRRLLP